VLTKYTAAASPNLGGEGCGQFNREPDHDDSFPSFADFLPGMTTVMQK